MHHIYHTEGIILGSRNYGEAGKYYDILTRDLGLVRASASGVRKVSSRLRYVLQDFNYIKVDLVRGKDFWRVTTASKSNVLESFSKNIKAVQVFANIARLLRRLLAGESENIKLFDNLIQGMAFLSTQTTPKEMQNTEAVIVLRILNDLGYIGSSAQISLFLDSPFLDEILPRVRDSRAEILKHINNALKETHL